MKKECRILVIPDLTNDSELQTFNKDVSDFLNDGFYFYFGTEKFICLVKEKS